MSLRIHFHSSDFPESVAKSLRRRLERMGHAVPLGRMREATAVMYGYGKWNELLGRIGQSTPFLSDQEADPAVVAERAAVFAERLSQALELPAHVAAEVVAAVGPTSRRSMGVVPFDWDEAVLRMAGSITATARSIEALSTGNFEGFRANAAGPHRDWAILVDEAGAAIFCVARGGRAEPDLYQIPEGGMFGRQLQAAGLLGGGAVGDPDPVVLRTLRRLDGRALGLLRTVPAFGEEVYAVARLVPEGSAFADLVARVPMIGAEIAHFARDLNAFSERRRGRTDPRKAMIESADPMAAYLDIVGDFAGKAWPHLAFDRQRGRETIEAIGNVVVLEGLGLQPQHVAFLSFAPAAKLPATPTQMAAAMLFIDGWTRIFEPRIGMAPADFYREFDGDWALLRSAVGRMKPARHVNDLGEVADAVTTALFGPRVAEVSDPRGLPGGIVVGILERRLTQRIVADRGVMSLFGSYTRWRAVEADLDRKEVPDTVLADDLFKALSTTGLLPEDLRFLPPRGLLQSLCIDPDTYAQALLDPAEFSASEAEIRVTTSSAREAVAKSIRTDDPETEDLAGATTFHRAVIGGVVFEATLSAAGPCIEAVRGRHKCESVALGVCTSIATFHEQDGSESEDDDPDLEERGPFGTFVVKYSTERRIALDGFGDAEFEQLEAEFGISKRRSGAPDFYQSRAAQSLVAYVQSHPRVAKRFADATSYLGDWYGWAKENAPRRGPSPGNH